jgi:hypothetical protein
VSEAPLAASWNSQSVKEGSGEDICVSLMTEVVGIIDKPKSDPITGVGYKIQVSTKLRERLLTVFKFIGYLS